METFFPHGIKGNSGAPAMVDGLIAGLVSPAETEKVREISFHDPRPSGSSADAAISSAEARYPRTTTLNPTRLDLLETFALDVAIVRGQDFRLQDVDGREYLDFLAQYGALPFGHNPEEIWNALDKARSEQMPSLVQPLRPVEAERLSRRLAEITPGDLEITTFTNSGAETVEAAIKLARVRTGRDMILSTKNGFHGKTLGALSATGKPYYQTDFAAPAPGFDYVPFGDIAALRARFEADADRIAAFIFEPIQGEGGVICPPEGYLDEVISLCREFGVLSILDEIQTGLGRTGSLFACSSCTEAPDMLLLAKALGGGLMPIGACIVRPSAWDDRFGRLHSSTFANNNLACAVACATLDRLLQDDQALIRSVAENGAYFRAKLEDLQRAYPRAIKEVRGRGYMMAVEFQSFENRSDSATMAFSSLNGGITPLVSSYLLNVHGVLTAPLFNASHVMRLQPPLTVGRAEIDRAIDALAQACAAIEERDCYTLVHHLVASPRVERETRATNQDLSASRGAAQPEAGRFAFLIHYTEEEDLLRTDPSFRRFTTAERARWLDWVKRLGPGYARRVGPVTSKTGATAEGWIMSVPMLSADMRGKARNVAAGHIAHATDTAAYDGACRLGLGAFTSIATRGGELVTGRGVPITSGNTLTTVAAVQSIESIAARVGLSLENANIAIVGATGSIGRLAALMLARRARRLSLVGNAGNPFAPKFLANVADEVCASVLAATNSFAPDGLGARIQQMAGTFGASTNETKDLAQRLLTAFQCAGEVPPLTWSTDLEVALADADVVLVATSCEMTLIDPRTLRPGTLVCDVARPSNVSHADLSGSGVLVFDGGLVRPPFEVDLGPFQTLPNGLCWGCLGETMLLALARQEKDFSIGSKLPLDDADLIAELSREHGFEPASPQWYGVALAEADLDRFAAVIEMKHAEPLAPAYSDACAHSFRQHAPMDHMNPAERNGLSSDDRRLSFGQLLGLIMTSCTGCLMLGRVIGMGWLSSIAFAYVGGAALVIVGCLVALRQMESGALAPYRPRDPEGEWDDGAAINTARSSVIARDGAAAASLGSVNQRIGGAMIGNR